VHELSIAQNLIALVLESLPDPEGTARVESVAVRIGALSGVVPEALRSAFAPAAFGTAAQGARLDVERVEVVAWCEACRREVSLPGPQRLRCPFCAAPTPRVVHGRELELSTVTLCGG
jgi:hydrogenase nickel incorporation protein HypA/HybF